MFDYVSFDGQRFDSDKSDEVEHLPPSMVKDELYAFDEGYLSDCYWFAQVLLCLPPLGDVGFNLDMSVEFGRYDGGPSDHAHHKMIVYANHTTWMYSILNKEFGKNLSLKFINPKCKVYR